MRQTFKWLGPTVLLFVSGAAWADPLQPVSLCELASHPDRYVGKRVSTSSHLHTSYHITYMSTEKCWRAWYSIGVEDDSTGPATDKFRAAMDSDRRMLGGDYYIEFVGTFRKFGKLDKADREIYGGYTGYFDQVELKSFTEEVSPKEMH